MIKYKTINVEQEIAEKVTCDVCGETYSFESDNVNDDLELQEFSYLVWTGGYGSVFGDESECSLDICQHCLKDKLGEYVKFKEN